MKLAGKVALVTGGSRGIGRAIVETFAHEGAAVIVNYCHREQAAGALVNALEAMSVGRIMLWQADVSQADQVKEMMAHIEARFGRLDILVNNAGIALPGTRLQDLTEEQWERVLAVNLKGMFLCSQAASTFMLRGGGGVIISLASVRGMLGGGSSLPYAVSKAGVITLTKSLAIELAPTIRVNCLAPGYIATELLAAKSPEALQKLEQVTLLKRLGSPEDVATAALFLASDDSAYLTGITLPVTGGFAMQ